MKAIRPISILPSGEINAECRWGVYDNGELVARFVKIIAAKAYRAWLEEGQE